MLQLLDQHTKHHDYHHYFLTYTIISTTFDENQRNMMHRREDFLLFAEARGTRRNSSICTKM